jgi:hypothetical protein
MTGLVPAIPIQLQCRATIIEIAGTSPAMTSFIVLAMHLHPSCGHDGNEKPRKRFALCTDLRQMTSAVGPVPSRSALQATM